jgi:hypothetical protein
MKINTIKTGIILIAMFVTISAMAQWRQQSSRHQFSVEAGGGLSTFNYKVAGESAKMSIGGTFGVGYAYFFNEQWGIGTGVAASLFNSKYKAASLSGSYQSIDVEDENFEYQYTANGYNETQQAIFLNIPLMLRFENDNFYAAAGVKAGIPISSKFKNDLNQLQAAGYYSQYDLTFNELEQEGFGTFNNINNDGDLELKTVFFASVEAGMKWAISEGLSVYTGLYLDYGLTDARKAPSTQQELIPYDVTQPSAYRPNSIMQSSTNGKSFVDKVTPFAAGIKISLVFK